MLLAAIDSFKFTVIPHRPTVSPEAEGYQFLQSVIINSKVNQLLQIGEAHNSISGEEPFLLTLLQLFSPFQHFTTFEEALLNTLIWGGVGLKPL
jgi:hypothetical protein